VARLLGTACAGLLLLPALTAPTLTACAGDDCDADTASWGSCSQGEAVDATHWESTPVSGQAYLSFHGERTWVLDPRPWMGNALPLGYEAYVAFTPYPDADGGAGFAEAPGNLAEFTQLPDGRVQVLNDTCAQYYLRVVLTYPEGTTVASTCKGDGG
jgi:hypothetical protein